MSQIKDLESENLFEDDKEEFELFANEVLKHKDTKISLNLAAATCATKQNTVLSKAKLVKPAGLTQVKCDKIYQKWVCYWTTKGQHLIFSNIGCWTLFYDEENIEEAWKKMIALYTSGTLFGVVKIARNNLRPSNKKGFQIYAFTGPASQGDFVKEVGRRLLCSMSYYKQKHWKKTRAQCSITYENKIYFKISKAGPCQFQLFF